MSTPDFRYAGPNFAALVNIFGREEALALIEAVRQSPDNDIQLHDAESIAEEYLAMHREGFWDVS